MFISMPPQFPNQKLQEFGLCAAKLFPAMLSDEFLADPLLMRQHFNQAFRAICYRYRSCSESNEQFKTLVHGAGESFGECGSDQEFEYQLERCSYAFFTNGL